MKIDDLWPLTLLGALLFLYGVVAVVVKLAWRFL